MLVIANLSAELLDHRLVGVGHEGHHMRNARIHGVDLKFARRKRKGVVQSKLFRAREVDCHALAVKGGQNHARSSFKRGFGFRSGLASNKTRKTTGAVAAHISGAAVAVVEVPAPVGFGEFAGSEQEHACYSDSSY